MPPRKKQAKSDKPETRDESAEMNQEPSSSEDNEPVEVPFGDNATETAVLLLAAAEESGAGQEVVHTGTGSFYVPAHVAKRAGVEVKKD